MKTAIRRVRLGLAVLVLCQAPVVAGEAGAQNAYRGFAPDALLRFAEQAPVAERPAILESFLERRALSLPVLRAAARAGSRDSRLIAIPMLAEMRDGGAVPALLEAADADDDGVRRRALSALRTLADPRAAARFRDIVLADSDPAAVKIAAAGLGRLGQPADRAVLRARLADTDEGVRVHAAGALAMLGSDEGEAVLLAAIDGDNPAAQKNATYGLGFLRTADSGTRLHRILADRRGRWKSYARIALAQRERARQTQAEELAELTLIGRGRDRIAADWAIEELTDLDAPAVTEILRELGQRHDARGAKARLRAMMREGR